MHLDPRQQGQTAMAGGDPQPHCLVLLRLRSWPSAMPRKGLAVQQPLPVRLEDEGMDNQVDACT
jgi:hypothetical protein